MIVVGCGASPESPPISTSAISRTSSTGPFVSPPAGTKLPGSASSPSVAPGATIQPGVRSGGLIVTVDRRRLPVATSRSVAFADGPDLILAGGLTLAGSSGRALRIPIASGPITADGHLAHPVHDAAAVTLGGARLVLGGGVTTQESWVQSVVLGGAGSVIGHLPAPRADLGAAVVGTEAIVVGGGVAGAADPRVLATSDGAHFRLVTRLPIAVRYAAVAAIGGLVFVIGGAAASGDVASIQVIDVAAGSARIVGHLGATLSHATAVVVGGSIVVAGGRHRGRAIDLIESIDPATFAVASAGRLPRPTSDATGVSVDGLGYLIGGEDAHPLATIVTIAWQVRS
jgi:Kelch motif